MPMITRTNFREILHWIGYYELDKYESEAEVRRYLSPDNIRLACGGQCVLGDAALELLGDAAIEHREHMI